MTEAWRRRALCVAASLVLAGAAFAQAPYYHATKLPDLPASWVQGWTLGVSLNDAGQVAGTTQMEMAVGWSSTNGLVPLSGDGQALGVAAGSGAMVGWSRGANGRVQAAAWSFPGGGASFLSDLYAGVPAYESVAHAVNNAGWVLISARASIDDPYRLMVLRPGQSALDLGESATGLYWEGGAANGIVGGNILLPGRVARGVVWTEAQGIRSFSVNGGDTFIEGVNANGWVVGRTMLKDAEGITQAQGFVHDAIVDQTLFGWMNFWPRDVNNSGLVVGILRDTGTYQRTSAAAWTSGAVVDLNTRTANLGFYELYQAVGVNAQGQILALGTPTKPDSGQPPLGTPGLATFLLSECLRCGQITPNPNPVGALLDVAPDWFDAFNEQDYRNFGTLQLHTVLENRAVGVLRNLGSLIVDGHGSLGNEGWFINESGGTLTVFGLFDNDGAGGLFTNHGTVSFLEGSASLLGGAGWMNEPGSVFRQSGGAIMNFSYFVVSGASFNQLAGAFSNAYGGHFIVVSSDATFGGDFRNSGHFGMNIDSGAPGRIATAVVTGTFENIASTGTPSMTIAGNSSFAVLAGSMISHGTVNVSGAGTTLRVASGGSIQLHAPGVAGGVSRIDVVDQAQLIVEGFGSELRTALNTTLAVGDATLVVRDQAVLINSGTLTNAGALGVGSGAQLQTEGRLENSGLIQLRGAGTQLLVLPSAGQSDGLVVTRQGILDIAEAAELRVAGRVQIFGGATVSNGGFITVDGGSFAIWDQVVGNGTLRQIAGSTYVVGLLQLSELTFEAGSVGGIGTIRGQVILGLDVTHDPALIRAGRSPGTLTIDGDLTINNALMELEVGDFRRYDRLVVTGNLQLGQFSAVLRPEAGYAPDLNDRFDWLSAGSIAGDLSSVTLDASALGGGWIAQAGAGGAAARITLDHVAATSWGPDLIGAGTSFLVNAGAITKIDSLRNVVSRGDVELRGFVAVRNDASLSIQGGTFTVAAGGRLTSRGQISHAGDAFVNAGLLRNYEDGSVGMYGPFTNRGVVENAGSWEQVGRFENEVGGRVVNHGTMTNRYGQGIVNRGRFENHGVIENGGFITNTEGGEFIVAAGAEVRSAGFGLDSYRDFGGITQVDGRLIASEIWLQGTTVRGSGSLVGSVTGDARFELRPADTLEIEGSLTGYHSFDVWIDGAAAHGYLTVSADATLQGGLLRFLLTEGGYVPQAGDSFKWLRAGGSVSGLHTLVWRIDVHVPGENGFDYPWTVPAGLAVTFSGDTLAVAAVPEPATWVTLLIGLGLAGLSAARRKVGSACAPA